MACVVQPFKSDEIDRSQLTETEIAKLKLRRLIGNKKKREMIINQMASD